VEAVIIFIWLLSILGFVLAFTGVAPGAINMAVGVGLAALMATIANRGLRLE
jgi:hypothetical protein